MMIENISFIMPYLSTSFMNLLIFLFLARLYNPKFSSKLFYIAAYIITTLLFIGVNKLVELSDMRILNFAYGFAYMHILSSLLFKSNYKKTFIYNSLFTVLLMFSDILTAVVLIAFKGEKFGDIIKEPNGIFLSNMIYIFVMFLLWLIMVSVLSKNNISEIKIKQIVLFGLFTIFEIFVVDSYAQEIEKKVVGVKTIIVLLGLILLNVYLVYLVEQIAKLYEEKNEYNLMQCQSKIQLDHFIDSSIKYEESRKMIHDIKKHLATLNALQFNENEKANEYRSLIERKVDSLLGGFQCTNNILSIIMSQKKASASNESIKIDTNVEDIAFEFMDDLDITAIFANLWDNAIEACIKTEPANRFINVIIGRVNDFIVISFENSFNGVINKKKDKILSTKEQHEGVGISIIRSSLKKYNGNLSMSYYDNVFKAEALLPWQQ